MTAWNARFETGHPHIDAEHREIFSRLASIEASVRAGAGREKIVEMVTLLQEYTNGHFSREEQFMDRMSCPARGDNCAAHRAFERRVDSWLQILTMGGTPASVLIDITRESVAWIEAHITRIDCRMRGCTPP